MLGIELDTDDIVSILFGRYDDGFPTESFPPIGCNAIMHPTSYDGQIMRLSHETELVIANLIFKRVILWCIKQDAVARVRIQF